MEVWAMIIALACSAVVAAVLAYVSKCRPIFWGTMLAAIFGLFLQPMQFASYDGPLDELSRTTNLAFAGTIPCAVGGFVITCIILRRNRRLKKDANNVAKK